MNDQAMQLRQLMASPRQDASLAADAGPPVLVIGSGKGGVGKSVVAALTAAAMAERGAKVLLLDGSQNLGHLHVLLGVNSTVRLEQVMRGDAPPEALLCRVADRLWLVPGDSGAEGLYALGAVDQARLHHRLSGLYDGFDAVVVDAGPGIETVVRLSTMRGTRLLVVTVPEVAALTDAYALIKLVHAQLPILPIDVIVNRMTGLEEARQAFERLATATERFLGRSLELLACLTETAALREAMQQPGRLLSDPALVDLKREVDCLVDRRFPLESPLSSGISPEGRSA